MEKWKCWENFAEMDDGKTGIYLLMPILEPGYYHFVLGLEEVVENDAKMDYLFYYQFTPRRSRVVENTKFIVKERKTVNSV